jgi:hypothetical protein
MTKRQKKWLIAITIAVGFGFVALVIVAHVIARRIDPYIRGQAILYLQQRFDSEAELASLRVRLPSTSPVKLLLNRGRGALVRVEGDGIVLRHKGRHDIPPMFVMKNFTCDVDLGTLFDTPKTVRSVTISGMEINIPPKGERPDLSDDQDDSAMNTGVIVQDVVITTSVLSIIPKDQNKPPLRFDLHQIRLETVGTDVSMHYDAQLTNAKPPGEILSKGKFGPWAAEEPGDTPLAGEYTFDDADLGVFSGVAGILDSTGQFNGTLSSIEVQGQASVADFRLKKSGNRVPLKTRFEVLVDGTNGNTVLKPVHGTLGTTNFSTSGGIIKRETDAARGISLDVTMPKGNLRDVLSLAMKGSPFMEGRISLKAKIDIPPLTGKVREKLILDGRFDTSQAKFLRSKIQSRIDELSRRGQGQPQNEEIDEVVHGMAGAFHLEDEVMTFKALSFAVPGAGVDLSGNYNLDNDMLDFHGALKLQAKVSETMSGWKRWVLKPVDPFFSKNGAGTFIRIQVHGTAKDPQFGRERDKHEGQAGINP